MPKFWVFLTQRWLELDQQLSWSWWRALGKSPWSACTDLRTHILHYDGHPYVQQQPEADRQRMDALIAPGALMRVLEDLVRQKLLLRRDAAQIEDAICSRLDRLGEWCSREGEGDGRETA
jgi:hypothetical protein